MYNKQISYKYLQGINVMKKEAVPQILKVYEVLKVLKFKFLRF